MKYPINESSVLEFKEAVNDYVKLIKTAIAFANTKGGEIVLGVQDKTGKLKGLDDAAIVKYSEEIPRAIYEAVTPSLIPNCFEKNIGGKILFVIKVFSGPAKPYYIKSEGLPAGIYVRVGSNTMRAKQYIVEDLLRQGQSKFYENELLEGLLIKTLDQILLQNFLGSVSENLLMANKIMLPDAMHQLKVTVAGALMFSKQPEKYIEEAYIIASKFRGSSGRNIESTREITGPVPEQISQAMDWILPQMQKNYKLKGAKLKPSAFLLPEVVVREIVINALAHRRYDIPSPVKIALFDDRLEVYNPGNFVGMIDQFNIGTGISQYRNPALCRMLRKMGLMEKQGTGVRLIFEECAAANLARPNFIEGADFVKVVAGFSQSGHGMISSEDKIVEYVRVHGYITGSIGAALLNVSKPTVLKCIDKLIKERTLTAEGRGRSKKYRNL